VPPPGARHRYESVTKVSRECVGETDLPAGGGLPRGHVRVPVTTGIASLRWGAEMSGGVSGRVLGCLRGGRSSVERDGDLGLRQLPGADEELDFRTRFAVVNGSRIADRARVLAQGCSKTACIPQAVDQLGQQSPNAHGDAHCAPACQRHGETALPGRPISPVLRAIPAAAGKIGSSWYVRRTPGAYTAATP
jgi:hypothetical protein